eukprot:3157319-Amphidinium_carterae.1
MQWPTVLFLIDTWVHEGTRIAAQGAAASNILPPPERKTLPKKAFMMKAFDSASFLPLQSPFPFGHIRVVVRS